MSLREELEKYVPINEQEALDRDIMLKYVDDPSAYGREDNEAHFTASSWVINQDHNRVLMCYHNIYDSWSWLGGHADGEKDLRAVAIREVEEESGIRAVSADDEILSVEILTVDGHEKKGHYVSSHLHLNVTYLLIADDRQLLRGKDDENRAVAWFDIDEVISKSSEKWFRERIYSKLNRKVREKYGKL